MIELKHIDKYYNIGTVNEVCLFKDFNLTVDDGDFISVIGSNGSGKTGRKRLRRVAVIEVPALQRLSNLLK